MKIGKNRNGWGRFRRKIALSLCFVLLLGLLPVDFTADAAEDTHNFSFRIGSTSIDLIDEYKLTSDEVEVNLQDGMNSYFEDNVTITASSQDSTIVAVQLNTYSGGNVYSFKLIRKGFGTTNVIGEIIETVTTESGEESQKHYTFNIEVTVDFQIDKSSDSWTSKSLFGYFGMYSSTLLDGYSLRLAYPGVQYQIKLKDFKPATDGAIHYSEVGLSWQIAVDDNPDDQTVATVENQDSADVSIREGTVTAIGAGMAKLTVMADSSGASKDLNVVVPLLFSDAAPAVSASAISASAISGAVSISQDEIKKGYKNFSRNNVSISNGTDQVTLYTTAANPQEDLEWEIKDEKGKDASDWFTMLFIPMDDETNRWASRIIITSAKAGTYKLKAYVKTLNSDLTYSNATFTMTIPVGYERKEVWMNVGDKYNIYNAINIVDVSSFSYVTSEPTNIVTVNSKGVVTAKKYGNTQVYAFDKSKYSDWQKAFDAGEAYRFDIHVVDSLTLSTENAKIPVGGTLELIANTTDVTEDIQWDIAEGEDTSIVSIEADGRNATIKGLKAGKTVVTATQVIGGVEKMASCEIEVVAAVTKVEIVPSEVELNIGGSTSLRATVTQKPSSEVELYWVSSDTSIVALENIGSITCTIVGKAEGVAVVTAINQENVVVGSCKVTVIRLPESLKLSDSSVTISESTGSYQLYATISPTTATNKNVNWDTSDSKVATVDSRGLVKVKSPGTVVITATSVASPSVKAFCTITITEAVTSVTLNESSLTLDVGDVYRLTYSVLPETAYNRGVTFTSMDSKVATVNSLGLITAKKAGVTYITITTSDGGYSKVCSVTVKQKATTIKLDAVALILDVGEEYNLQANFEPKTTTETTLRWSSNNTSVAKVDTKGCVTAVGAGDCIVTVTTSNNISTHCYVTIKQQVTGLELNYEAVTVDQGKFVELDASILPEKATNQVVTWKSSNESVAKVSENGTVQGVAGGSANITCTTDDGGFSAVCLVTVIEQVTTLGLNKSSYKLGLGKKYTLTAKVANSSASNQSVTWVSSNSKTCTVNQKGVITGVKLGTATITATANDGSGADASCEVRVVQQVTSIALNKNLLNLVVGDNSVLKATIKPTSATYKKANFSSDNMDVAMVDSDGRVTAVGAGTCKITAKAKDSSGLKAVCVVNVRPTVDATGVTVSPTEVTMGVGGTETINFSIRPADSTDTVVWSSNDKAVATVGKTSGAIRGVAPGTTVVTASTSNGRTATVRVTVVGLNYSFLSMEQYDSYQLRVLGVQSGVVWDVDNPDICIVSTNGKVTAKRAGSTTVIARINGAELRCRIAVSDIR